jgi:hypothetical protein
MHRSSARLAATGHGSPGPGVVARGLDPEVVLAALQEFGGFCDCELLANVTPDKFGWSD